MHSEITGQVQQLSAPDKKCWVNWRLEVRDGKPTKVPYMPNGQRASSTDSATWSTYTEVVAVQDRFSGIGIVFAGSLLGVDIDHCITDSIVSLPVAAFVETAETYTEISPSRTGLHLYMRLTEPMRLERNRYGNFEVYTSGRFFTVTGQPWAKSYPLRTVIPEEAFSLLRMLGYPWNKETSSPERVGRSNAISLPDAELLKKMFSAQNGAKIRALYDGDTSMYGNDESRADAALCSHLAFWSGGDASRMESLWLTSPLGSREKT